MPARRAAVVLVVAAALGASGCAQTTAETESDSSGDFSGQARLVATTIEDLQEAGTQRDYDQICRELLARPLVDRLSAQPDTDACPDALDRSLGDVSSFDLAVRRGGIRVSGDRATASVISDLGDEEQSADVQLVREGSRWKISAL